MGSPTKIYSKELQESFLNMDWLHNPSAEQLLLKVQEGLMGYNGETESFTYLLLDPRITKNLRARANNESRLVLWASFIDSIYYVGQGRDSRGYQHFKNALKEYNQGKNESSNPKIQRILNIWSENYGGLVLHVFDFMPSDEAHTYEAAIIDVIGLNNLTNVIRGNYRGNAEDFTPVQKNMLGLNLLWRAFNINIISGEQQMKPEYI